MEFKNPWGKGSSQYDKWFSNTWNSQEGDPGKFAASLGKIVEDPNNPPETVTRSANPGGKTINNQLIAFDWKGTAEKLNNSINWEMGSGEWIGEGAEPFEKGPAETSKTIYITELVFPSAESINKWNDQLETVNTRLSVASGVGVGLATLRINPYLGIIIGTGAGLLTTQLLTPIDVKLNPNDKIILTSTIQTIRCTNASQNSIDFSVVISAVGTNPKILKTIFDSVVLNPNENDADEQMMKTYESNPATITTLINPNYSLGMPAFRFVRTN